MIIVIYVLVFVVGVAILLGAFRAMGGETVSDEDAMAFVDRVVAWVDEEAEAVAVLGTLSADAMSPAELGEEAMEDRVRAARKALAGYQQQLTRFEVDNPTQRSARVRVLVSTAIESLGWACRMAETGHLDGNPGVRAAVADLHAHACACLAEAHELADAVDREPTTA